MAKLNPIAVDGQLDLDGECFERGGTAVSMGRSFQGMITVFNYGSIRPFIIIIGKISNCAVWLSAAKGAKKKAA